VFAWLGQMSPVAQRGRDLSLQPSFAL